MMGTRMPETWWAVFKWQAINLRNCCIRLVDSFEYMMMHGLTSPKHSTCFGRSFHPSWVQDCTSICQTDTAKLLASRNVSTSKQVGVCVWHIPDAVCTVLNSWWWMERPSETCRVLFQNKINLRNWCI
jgi:hypothetical protein